MGKTKDKYIELQEERILSGDTEYINEMELLEYLFGGRYDE